jgi:hypothetical protein
MNEERFSSLEIMVSRIDVVCQKMDAQLESHTTQDNDNFKEIKEDIKELNKTVTTLSTLQNIEDKENDKRQDRHATIKLTMLTILLTASIEVLRNLWAKITGV